MTLLDDLNSITNLGDLRNSSLVNYAKQYVDQYFGSYFSLLQYYYNYNYYLSSSLCVCLVTYLLLRYDPVRVRKLLYLLFDKGTNAYTFSRLCCNNVYKSFKLIKKQAATQTIVNIFLIRTKANKQSEYEEDDQELEILDLTHLKDNLQDFDWSDYVQNHISITTATDSRLEIVYEIGGDIRNQYVAIVPYLSQPKFPIYSSSELKKLNSNWENWEDLEIDPPLLQSSNGDGTNNTDEVENVMDKIWSELEKYGGPSGNFYQNCQADVVKVKGDWILDHSYNPPIPLLKPGTKVTLLDTLGDVLKL